MTVWKRETSTGVEKGLVSVLYDTSIIYYAKTRIATLMGGRRRKK